MNSVRVGTNARHLGVSRSIVNLRQWKGHFNQLLADFQATRHRYFLLSLRGLSRSRPICSIRFADTITASKLIGGTSVCSFKYPARYSSDGLSMPSLLQTR